MGEGKIGAGKISWDDQFLILDKNGGSFHSYYDGVEGDPFFMATFRSALIKLASGEEFNNISARLDVYTQMIQIKLNGDTAKYILPGVISEVIFFDTLQSKPVSYKFQCGYPAVDKLNKNSFYQVLSEGKVELLKSQVKKINKLKNDMTGEVSSQFDNYEDHYVYVNYEIKRLKKDKEYILDLLSDKRKELEAYSTSQKVNFKSTESVKKLIDYYNSIAEPIH